MNIAEKNVFNVFEHVFLDCVLTDFSLQSSKVIVRVKFDRKAE